jgi:hypothetical protein
LRSSYLLGPNLPREASRPGRCGTFKYLVFASKCGGASGEKRSLDATAFNPKNAAKSSAVNTATSQACLDGGLDDLGVRVFPLVTRSLITAFLLIAKSNYPEDDMRRGRQSLTGGLSAGALD